MGGVIIQGGVTGDCRFTMEVLNEIGHGFHEKPYENSLVIEFRFRGIVCLRQKQLDNLYKN
jgi:GxxExxY protein